MKTAEEWINEVGKVVMLDCFAGDRSALPGEPTLNLVKQIQLDAMKEGMMRAAYINKITSPHITMTGSSSICENRKNAILTAAEHLTEKDL
jgi:hypothetical protein